MIYKLKNEYLYVEVESRGAELRKLVDKDNRNRLHEPSVDTWNKVSPILFPQVSRLKDDMYTVNNQTFIMPKHGFFKDEELTPLIHTNTKLEFVFKDNEDTLKMYPFHFEFIVKYELINNSLKVSFKVTNTGNNIMYYMLGGHPGFKVPLFENESFEDYYIKFPYKENVVAMQVVNSYLANEFKQALNNEDILCLKRDLFKVDAVVLCDLKSNYADLLSNKNKKQMRFHFHGFEKLAFWTKYQDNANFVCFEPWSGIQKEFVKEYEKMGILKLMPNECKESYYQIEIIN